VTVILVCSKKHIKAHDEYLVELIGTPQTALSRKVPGMFAAPHPAVTPTMGNISRPQPVLSHDSKRIVIDLKPGHWYCAQTDKHMAGVTPVELEYKHLTGGLVRPVNR
jgi:hypothetical protein